jgi:hypothetical protein
LSDPGALEREVLKIMDDAVRGTPLVLGMSTGTLDKRAEVSREQEFDTLLDIVLGVRNAVQRVAREIDERPA